MHGDYKFDEELINNIPDILEKINNDRKEEDKISIRKMSIDLNISYAGMHRLFNRKDLASTPLGTLNNISNYLGVSLTDLYTRQGGKAYFKK